MTCQAILLMLLAEHQSSAAPAPPGPKTEADRKVGPQSGSQRLGSLSSTTRTNASAGAGIAIEWARPVTLASPEPWTMSKDKPLVSEGILVQLRVDPALLVPLQTLSPVPYAGDRPMMPFNADYVGGCLVALVAGPIDLATTPLFFGSPELPERIDAAAGAAERQAAEKRGVAPLPPKELAVALSSGGGPLQASDLRDVRAAAMERVALCSQTPEDQMRPGIPSAP